jgi:beta-lactamase superfamily II metal-dependent hydrolase
MCALRHFLFLFLTAIGINPVSLATAGEVTIFDCGQGNCAVAKYNNQTMVFDAGRKGWSKFVAHENNIDDQSTQAVSFPILSDTSIKMLFTNVIPTEKATAVAGNSYKTHFDKQLKKSIYGSKGDSILEAVFVSHPDIDHFNLIAPLDLRPKAFILGGQYKLYSKVFRDFINNIQANSSDGKKVKVFKENDLKDIQQGTFEIPSFKGKAPPVIEILSANAALKNPANNNKQPKPSDRNTDSMIVKIQGPTWSILSPGDAELTTWEDANEEKLKNIDVLLLSHHGSETKGSTSKKILDIINPKICLISAGFEHHHPTSTVISLLRDYYKTNDYRTNPHFITCYDEAKKGFKSIITNLPIFTTMDNGSLTVNLSSKSLEIKVSRDFYPCPDEFYTYLASIFLFKPVEDRASYNLKSLMSKKGAKLIKNKNLGEQIFEKKTKDNQKEYYFKYGDAYLQMEIDEEEL